MKEEDIWNRILLVVEVGDLVRFKYGKVVWKVIASREINGKHWIKLMRRRYGCLGWGIYTYYKEVWQDSPEYSKLRVVER